MSAVEEVRTDYAVLRSCWVYGGCNVEGREGQGGPRVLQGCCVRRVPWVEVSDGWVGRYRGRILQAACRRPRLVSCPTVRRCDSLHPWMFIFTDSWVNPPRVRYLTAPTGAYASTCAKVSRSKSRSRTSILLCDTVPKALPRLIPIDMV